MSEPKWTPGPWECVIGAANTSERLVVQTATPRTKGRHYAVARCYANLAGDSPHNARLIAAAPELYAALAELVEEIETDGGVDTSCWPILDAGKAALAKARGEA